MATIEEIREAMNVQKGDFVVCVESEFAAMKDELAKELRAELKALMQEDDDDVFMRNMATAVLHNGRWLATKLMGGESAAARRELYVSACVRVADGEGFVRRCAEARTAKFQRGVGKVRRGSGL